MRKDLQNVEALTFDPISRLLYWVDAGAQKIEVQEGTLCPCVSVCVALMPERIHTICYSRTDVCVCCEFV